MELKNLELDTVIHALKSEYGLRINGDSASIIEKNPYDFSGYHSDYEIITVKFSASCLEEFVKDAIARGKSNIKINGKYSKEIDYCDDWSGDAGIRPVNGGDASISLELNLSGNSCAFSCNYETKN